MSALIQLLDRPIAYNPAFAKLKVGKVKAGPVAAVFLSQMVYWHNRMGGVWMYKTQADITSETALTRDEQETARKRLVSLGVLEEDRRGVPATMHYRIDAERLETLLLETTKPAKKVNQDKTRLGNFQNVETPQSGLVQSRKLDCGDATNKNVETQQTRKGEPPEQACGDPAIFPTGDYTENTQKITQEKNNSRQPAAQTDREVEITDQAKQILSHLNLVTGSRYQVSKSSLENIRARLGENFTVDDLNLVVDYSQAKWGADIKMAEYLRPATLFQNAKFPGYLQSATKWDAAGRPENVNGQWVKPGEVPAGDTTERDAAYRRYMSGTISQTKPSELEQRVCKAASTANLRKQRPEFAISRWNAIWKEQAQRGNQGEAA
ncbi:conserved phage C-terminal domain-containing protein [Buttiauxella selenatireducens]|uniref:Conserved phage C-terminal domain-containing protein n=1 Tax=Buttiauxella selenatireducens TaxID=3073902 RepID=A0ABY9S5Y9_9ENTR|nr:conserved phage C-terminal domain-containing protein [Buttiauxella sp. R73]WMY72759.1 conserved phage C-terminal domain-containing protein [Buttiauxella sp. R73]